MISTATLFIFSIIFVGVFLFFFEHVETDPKTREGFRKRLQHTYLIENYHAKLGMLLDRVAAFYYENWLIRQLGTCLLIAYLYSIVFYAMAWLGDSPMKNPDFSIGRFLPGALLPWQREIFFVVVVLIVVSSFWGASEYIQKIIQDKARHSGSFLTRLGRFLMRHAWFALYLGVFIGFLACLGTTIVASFSPLIFASGTTVIFLIGLFSGWAHMELSRNQQHLRIDSERSKISAILVSIIVSLVVASLAIGFAIALVFLQADERVAVVGIFCILAAGPGVIFQTRKAAGAGAGATIGVLFGGGIVAWICIFHLELPPKGPVVLLLFFSVLPLCSGILDYVSIGITRWLGNKLHYQAGEVLKYSTNTADNKLPSKPSLWLQKIWLFTLFDVALALLTLVLLVTLLAFLFEVFDRFYSNFPSFYKNPISQLNTTLYEVATRPFEEPT